MSRAVVRSLALVAAIVLLVGAPALAQGGAPTSQLSGVVGDPSGAVIPGADVTVTNNATNAVFSAVTDGAGAFTIPALNPGTYIVKVSLMGFKTVVLPDVTVITGMPATIKRVLMQVGGLEETVIVSGATEIVQTQTATVSVTISAAQISSLPLATRNSLDFVAMMPGVDTTGVTRNATVMGLRPSSTNMTIDGFSIADNYTKSSAGNAMYAFIRPNLDAVEEITVSTANPGAESAGQGAVQVRFVTRSGTNTFRGSAYEYLRGPSLNTNYWFNIRDGLAKDQVKLNTWGFRVGGPVVIPKLFNGKDKLFFFFNYEQFRQPNELARNKTILTPQAQQGVFQYNTAAGVQTVNLLALAAAKSQVSTLDPLVARLLADIRSSTTTTGAVTQLADPNLQRFTFQGSSTNYRSLPTARIDMNVTKNHKAAFSTYFQQVDLKPDMLNGIDPAFPDFPNWGAQTNKRWAFSGSLRSLFGKNVFNEARVAGAGGRVYLRREITLAQFSGTPVADQGGFYLNIGAAGISTATVQNSSEMTSTPSYNLEDTLSWIRGNHTWSIGGSATQVGLERTTQVVVPTISFGIDSADPALSMFSVANFPGASTTDLANARGIYSVLTGRVTGIAADAYFNEQDGLYNYLGARTRRGHLRQFAAFAQDAWRVRPSLTLNYGVRYELQMPFVSLNDSLSFSTLDGLYGVSGVGNLFKPGTMTGTATQFYQLNEGTPAFKTDWNNFAPSVGGAWRPTITNAWLKRVLGSDPVVRGGYSIAYSREGMQQYANVYENNPGGFISASRNSTLGNLINPGETLPLLLRDTSRLGAPAFNPVPSFPMSGVMTNSVTVFDPNIVVPYTHSFSVGLQRALTKNTAVEVRYVGTRNKAGWISTNYNEVNIRENGFLPEFKLAQANLQANIAAGRGATFKYFGPGTGTSALPIYLAYFSGVPTAQAGDSSKYTSTLFANSFFVNPLAATSPNPYTPASSNASAGLYGDAARRANAATAGLPANFFVANPGMLGGANLFSSETFTRYDALQVEVRRRMAAGLLIQANYVYANADVSGFYTLREARPLVRNAGVPTHAFKVNWVYELPFGQGKRFGGGVGRNMNRLIGGWEFDGAGRVQTGQLMDIGNVRLVGFTQDELADLYQVRMTPDAAGKTRVYMLPQDIIDNTVKAFSVSATSPTGYGALGAPSGRYFAPANNATCIQEVAGDCGVDRHNYVNGPAFVRWDVSLVKRVPITRTVVGEFRAEVLNALNSINFIPVGLPANPADPTAYEVTTAYRDTSNAQDPGGRLIQIVARISW